MNWVDIFLLAIFMLSIWIGWHRGFLIGSLDLMAWAGSLVVAYGFYPLMARGIERITDMGVWKLPVAFILTLLITRLLLSLLLRLIIRRVPEQVNESGVNKFMGIIPGAINGWIFAVVLSALLLSLPLKDSVTAETRNSRYAGQLAMQSEWANKKLAVVFDEAVRQTMNSLTLKPGEQGSHDRKIELPFTTNNAPSRPELEAKMLILINKERAKENLPPLTADPEMRTVARLHSQDMFARGFFAHENPDGQSPFDRMKQANVSFRAAGENLALAQTMEIAHTNLMNSPGHRANIMNVDFGRVGIGILDGGFYGLMISQEFRNP